MAAESRRSRTGERGQVLLLFLLIFVTLVLFAIVAIAVGQTLVRRQHAQMVVDAAAFAGASKQAEGLNTIAHWNQKELDFLQAIHLSLLAPYKDDSLTTYSRELPPPAWYDWAGPIIKDYQDEFDLEDDIITGANHYYSIANVATGPSAAASDVVDANFSGPTDGDRLFRGETPKAHGMLIDPTTGANPLDLVELTDRQSYPVKGYQYIFAPEVYAEYLWTCDMIPPNLHACHILAMYALANTYYEIKGQVSPIKYQLGRFYADDQPEVRFSYYLQVRNTPTILGRNFFSDIPPITVVSSAKPYGGYLGDKYKRWPLHAWTSQYSGREISETYKAKLVPVSGGEKSVLIALIGPDDITRYAGVLH